MLSITNPFVKFTEYNIRDEAKTLVWDEQLILTTSTERECGAPVFEILNSDGTAIDATIFTDNRATGNNQFVIETDDRSKAGPYPFILRGYFADAPGNFVDSDIFNVLLINTCVEPVSFSPSVQAAATPQSYND